MLGMGAKRVKFFAGLGERIPGGWSLFVAVPAGIFRRSLTLPSSERNQSPVAEGGQPTASQFRMDGVAYFTWEYLHPCLDELKGEGN